MVSEAYKEGFKALYKLQADGIDSPGINVNFRNCNCGNLGAEILSVPFMTAVNFLRFLLGIRRGCRSHMQLPTFAGSRKAPRGGSASSSESSGDKEDVLPRSVDPSVTHVKVRAAMKSVSSRYLWGRRALCCA